MKTHFIPELGKGSACGRGQRTSDNPFAVTCSLCQGNPEFVKRKTAADAAREAAFWAQVPNTVVPQFGRVNDDGVMECPWCEGTLWRERPRTLWSYHYVCANTECGKSVHPLTETGMCT